MTKPQGEGKTVIRRPPLLPPPLRAAPVIDHVGLSPDIEVKGEPNRDKSQDKQLQRAIAEVQKSMRSIAGRRN